MPDGRPPAFNPFPIFDGHQNVAFVSHGVATVAEREWKIGKVRFRSRRKVICLQKHERRACASSPRHVLSRCYRGWDQDQISLVRNW